MRVAADHDQACKTGPGTAQARASRVIATRAAAATTLGAVGTVVADPDPDACVDADTTVGVVAPLAPQTASVTAASITKIFRFFMTPP